MTTQNPIQSENGIISCPTCATKPVIYLEHKRTTLSYIKAPTIVRSLPQPKEESSLKETAFFILFIFIFVMILNMLADIFHIRKKHE